VGNERCGKRHKPPRQLIHMFTKCSAEAFPALCAERHAFTVQVKKRIEEGDADDDLDLS
jgi:hypothetical protein